MSLNFIHCNYGIYRARFSNLNTLSEFHFNDVNQQIMKNYSSQPLTGTLGSSSPIVRSNGLLIAEGQFAQIPISTVKPTSSGLSILAYFKATTKTSGMRIFFTDASSTFSLYCYSNDSIGFDMGGSTTQNFSYRYMNNKVCCIATFLPNNSIKLFINKTQVSSTNIFFNETISIGTNCFIGKESSGTSNFFNGEIYSFITYPFALTQPQIDIETNRITSLL